MDKVILMLLLAVVTGCENISNMLVNSQPRSKTLTASCDGTRISWDYCYEVAAKLCPSGYVISDKKETSDSDEVANRTHVTRNMFFKCK